ncbi:MAG TPA: fibronectin type III domain-containing protein [Pyrinomonadaceae bacterium]
MATFVALRARAAVPTGAQETKQQRNVGQRAGAPSAPADACTLPGNEVATDPAGDELDQVPSHDLLSISVAEPNLGTGINKLFFTLKLSDLQTLTPQTFWQVTFTAPDTHVYYIYMRTFTDSPTVSGFIYGKDDTDVGDADPESHYDPATGTITLVIQNAKVGNPTAGQMLTKINAEVDTVVLVADRAPNAGTSSTASYTLVGNETCPAPPPPPPTPTPTPPTGLAPRYQNYAAPNGLGGSAGEPSLGTNWLTGRIMYIAGFQVLRVTFGDCPSPANATWQDVTPPNSISPAGLDPILFTDHMRTPSATPTPPNRTFVSQLTGQDSASAYTDNDGDTWTPSQGGGIPSGVDHQTIGAGPYKQNTTPPPPVNPTYPNAVYYCSQDVAVSFCARSDDGGLTYGAGVPIYNLTQCTGIHGHVKVSPDGTVYVPNRDCGGKAGVARSTDNGVSWVVKTIPTSSTTGFLVDPSIGIAHNTTGRPNGQTVNTIYLGYQAADANPHIAVSHDEGDTWTNDTDAGAAAGLKNSTFPEVVVGDDNRVAYAFLGTTVEGNYTDLNGYPHDAPWHLYIATSFDGGGSYHLVDATPNDPVQRGSICNLGTTTCDRTPNDRNLLDFMDETIDVQGRVLVAYPDGCITPTCINNTPAQGARPNDYTARATIARQSGGRPLFSANDPVEPSVPAAPSAMAVRNGGVIHVTWSTPDNGGSPITAYKIYRGTPGGDEILLATVPGNVNSYDDATASPDITYYYRVTAVNAVGEGTSCGLAFVVVPESPCRLPGRTAVVDTSDSGQNTPPDPRVDIRSISVAEPFLGAGVNKLVFTMKLAPSTMNTAPPNSQWFIIWDRINNTDPDFDRWYVAMRTDAAGTPSFEYGKFGVLLQIVPPDPNPNANTPVRIGDADSGVYDPITGLLRITLSTDKFESPSKTVQPGQSLNNLNGRTYLNRPDPGQRSQNNANDITGNGSYTLVGNAACTPSAVAGGDVIISEFRFRGPTPTVPLSDGATDEFIELYNATSSDIIVGGAGGGWALATNTAGAPLVIAVIPSGTGIPAHGHYLVTNSGGYSLSGYAPPDQTYTGDISDTGGIALFGTTVPADFTLENRLDAVGFQAVPSLFSEGNSLQSPGANDGEYSFLRTMAVTGLPADTNNNAADFAFVSTNAGSYGGVQSTLGAPGPENTQSPIQRNAQIKASPVDPGCSGGSNDPTTACGRVRNTADVGPNKSMGTLAFRRRFTNRTGLPVTKLRLRIVDITTAGGRTASQADLRALDSPQVIVMRTDGTPVTLQATTVETPPAQPMGGGLNTSLVVTLPGGALGPNAPIDLQIVTGVEAGGSFRFFVNVEALNGTPPTNAPARGGKGGPLKQPAPAPPDRTAAAPDKTAAAPDAPAPAVATPSAIVQLPRSVAPAPATQTERRRRTKRTRRAVPSRSAQ